jgi:phospholipid-binding lipoprotein MlaA
MKSWFMTKIASLPGLRLDMPGRNMLLAASLLLSGCSTAPIQTGDTPDETVFPAEDIVLNDKNYEVEPIYDPWEGFNRTMYRFNYRFDKYVFLPAVGAYQYVTPDFVEQGIHNFFTNFRQISTLINSILQFDGAKIMETTARLLVNTTLGILGLFDVATEMGLPYHEEDFGQTLGVWGVGSGPYLVLPILGPSTLRDGAGIGFDTITRTDIRDQMVDLNLEENVAWSVLDAIDTRANVGFRYYETGSPFEYDWVRLLYTTKRKLDVEK